MPPFDDDFDMTSDQVPPYLPQDQGAQPEAPPSAHDLPAPALGSAPQPVTQLGLASNYWRDNPVTPQAPDPLRTYLDQRTQELSNRIYGGPIPMPSGESVGSDQGKANQTGAYHVPAYSWEDPEKKAHPPGTAGVPIAIDDEYSKLPFEMVMTIGASGTALDAERNNIGESPLIQNLVKNVPSWAAADAGRPMSGQAETFVPSENTIVLANSGAHGSDSANLVFHAVAHAYGKASGDADQSQAFKNVWSASQKRLPDKYYSGDPEKMTDPVSKAAEETRAQKETYAESLARFLSGAPNYTPEIDQYWQAWSKAKGW